MEFGQVQESKYNPKNRFLFCCCHSYEVDKGWGFGCFGCRAFPFSCGVWVFSLIMLFVAGKDIFDLTNSKIYHNTEIMENFLPTAFKIKLIGDGVCFLAILCAIFSTIKRNYVLSIVAYYLGFISLILSSVFCGYAIFRCFEFAFWNSAGVFTIIFWGVAEYILLLFDWILFCNMVDIKRKNDESAKNNTQWGFN